MTFWLYRDNIFLASIKAHDRRAAEEQAYERFGLGVIVYRPRAGYDN